MSRWPCDAGVATGNSTQALVGVTNTVSEGSDSRRGARRRRATRQASAGRAVEGLRLAAGIPTGRPATVIGGRWPRMMPPASTMPHAESCPAASMHPGGRLVLTCRGCWRRVEPVHVPAAHLLPPEGARDGSPWPISVRFLWLPVSAGRSTAKRMRARMTCPRHTDQGAANADPPVVRGRRSRFRNRRDAPPC